MPPDDPEQAVQVINLNDYQNEEHEGRNEKRRLIAENFV